MGSFNRKRGLIWLESLVIPMLILGFLVVKCGVYFEMNDDRIINEFFTGVLTGTPDGHAIFVNYLLGALFSWGYQINGEIPWYGGFLVLAHLLVYWSFFGLVLERCKNWAQHILGIVTGCFFVLSNLYIFGQIQYTSTAILLAACGYLWLLFDESKKRKYILFFVFELLAYLLRTMSMLMVQPIGGVLFGITLLLGLKKEDLPSLKAQVVKGLTVVGILVSCLGIGWVGNYVAGDYGSAEWKEYTYFREIRGDMADYYGFPEYGKVEDILEEYDISENEYAAYVRYWMLGNEIEIECLERLHEVAKADYEAARSGLTDVLKALVTSRFQGGIVGYGKYTLVLYAFVGALMLVRKKWDMLCQILALNFARNGVLGYLIYRERLPFRVLSGLYFIELLFLFLWLFILLKDIAKEKLWIKLATGLVAFASLFIFCEAIGEAYSALYWTNYNKKVLVKGMDELIDYCTESDKGYICTDIVTTYYTGDALSMDWYRDRNYVTCGFWCSQSPAFLAHQKEYLAEHQGNLRLIDLREDQDLVSQSAAEQMLTEDWGVELTFVEEIVLSSGIVLDVYDIIGEVEY